MDAVSEKPLIRKQRDGIHAGRWVILEHEDGPPLGNASFSTWEMAMDMGVRWFNTGYLTTVPSKGSIHYITEEEMDELYDSRFTCACGERH